MNLIDVTKKFATPDACNDFIESMRWPDGVTCLKCDSKRVTKYQKQAGTRKRVNATIGEAEEKPVPARVLYVCLDCGDQFSVTEGTIFNDTHLDLEKWFMAGVKHLHRCLSEFQFRWNNREAQDMFLLVIAALMIGSPMPYNKLVEPLWGETATGPEVELVGEPF